MEKAFQEPLKPKGIKAIAEALDISIGTVDRALHNRKGVSDKTRSTVLKMAETLNYSPNVVARNLKLQRQLRIGVYLPEQISSYFNPLRDGIRTASLAELSSSIDLRFFEYPTLGEGDLEMMQRTDWAQFDGLILAPGHPGNIADVLAQAEAKNISVVCVTTDAPRMPRLASITADSHVSGSMAAEFLGSWIREAGEVAMFTGDLRVQDHSAKLQGFAASLAMYASHLRLLPAIEAQDRYDLAYAAAKALMAGRPDLSGIYVNTANCLPVLTALRESGRAKQVKMISTDISPEIVTAIESGEITASLYQRPFTQGKLALELLARFLSSGAEPKQHIRLAPHLIVRSNLPLFIKPTASRSRR